MGRCVIVGGAKISDYSYPKKHLLEDDYFIFCDCGLRHSKGLLVTPDLIVGDFDSSSLPKTDIETIILPREKDDTDTVFAIKEGIKRGFKDFLLLGVVGERLDHSLVNVYALLLLQNNGCNGTIIDDFSEMEIVGKDAKFVSPEYSYFSLVNIGGVAKNITIKNAKYNLENAEIFPEYQYATSNECINESPAEITVGEGNLLLIKVK
ncbi:MAG: thiamine diphosphokinase [Clostridia bacterium]|nr:thiamine diphosphokinase [Clostridia bacterium]